MLTRKDYVAIADCIALSRVKKIDEQYKDYESGINAGCQDVIHRLIDYFEKDNPDFDQQRFLTACGI